MTIQTIFITFIFLVWFILVWLGYGLFLLNLIVERSFTLKSKSITSKKIFIALPLGIGTVSLLTLFIGMLKLLNIYGTITIFVIGSTLILFYLVKHFQEVAQFQIRFNQTILQKGLLTILFGGMFYSLLSNVLMPPTDWDTLAYHYALPLIYIRQGSIVYVPFIVHSNWPMNIEMLFVTALMFRGEILANSVTWILVLITSGVIYHSVEQVFKSKLLGTLSATLYCTSPIVLRLAGIGLVEAGLGLFMSASLNTFFLYLNNRKSEYLVLCFITAGFAAGSKLIGVVIPIFFGVVILYENRGTYLKKGPYSVKHLWEPITLGIMILITVAPWYLRSYINTGNPIWPFLYKFFGGRNWDSLGDEYHTNMLKSLWSVELPNNLVGFLQSIQFLITEPQKLGGFPGFGQTTLFFAFFGIFFTVLYYRTIPKSVFYTAIFSIAYYLLWFLGSSHQIRFLFPILPGLILLTINAIHNFLSLINAKVLQWSLITFFVLFWLKDYPWFNLKIRNSLLQDNLPAITDKSMRQKWLQDRVSIYVPFAYINQNLNSDAKVLLLPYENRGYYLNIEYFWGHPISQRVIKFEQYETSSELVIQLQKMGITHIFDNNSGWLYDGILFWDHNRSLMLAVQANCSNLIQSWGKNMHLYELANCTNELKRDDI